MKKINMDSIVWSFVLFSLIFCFLAISLNGELKNYIHPDITKYLYFAIFIITIMAIFVLNEALKGKGEELKSGYLLFLLPIIIYLVVKPSGLTESTAFNRGVNLNFYNYLSKNIEHESDNHNHQHSDGKLIIRDNKLIINNSNFFSTLKELHKNSEKYKNNSIVIEGFVLKSSSLGGSFILGRMVVSCCAADMDIIGIRCESDKTGLLTNKEWVQVEGVFEKGMGNNAVPFIKVNSIRVIDEPKERYLYRD